MKVTTAISMEENSWIGGGSSNSPDWDLISSDWWGDSNGFSGG